MATRFNVTVRAVFCLLDLGGDARTRDCRLSLEIVVARVIAYSVSGNRCAQIPGMARVLVGAIACHSGFVSQMGTAGSRETGCENLSGTSACRSGCGTWIFTAEEVGGCPPDSVRGVVCPPGLLEGVRGRLRSSSSARAS